MAMNGSAEKIAPERIIAEARGRRELAEPRMPLPTAGARLNLKI
jgi:hypothetical protein